MKKVFLGFGVMLVLASTLLPLATQKAAAATDPSLWQPGRIIDDVIFTNSTDMSALDVQNFLNQKVGTGYYGLNPGQCDTNGTRTSELGGGTRAQYGAAHNNPAPFTCLKDYYEVPKTDPGIGIPASNYGGAAIPAGAKSSAQIIWDAAQRYSINPKVLVVMIQKESVGPLITDDWPTKSQYTYAMGAHCPDGPNGAMCDGDYAGFSIQIYESARLLRYYLNNMQQPSWTYAKPFTTNQVKWNTVYSSYVDGAGNSVACGSGAVYIQSMATAALYTYTPYQPNQAALNNLYGSVPSGNGFDSRCAAYGNRNFWRYYTDWFGSTYAPNYSWQLASQYAYTDNTKTTGVDMNNLTPGQKVYVGFTAKNTGNITWSSTGANAILAGTSGPLERSSVFANGSNWLSPTKPALMKEATVAPGQTGTFEFYMSIPTNKGSGGIYNERFNLLANGITWMNDVGLSYYVRVPEPTYTWQMTSQYAYSDSTKTSPVNMATLTPGQKTYVGFTAKNTGNTVWSNTGSNPITVGTNSPMERSSAFSSGSGWLSSTRPALLKESSVAPGQTGTFEFYMTAPIIPGSGGTYNERFNLLANGITWMNDVGLSYYLNVR